MRKNLVSVIALSVLVAAAGTASAGGQSGSIGVGAEADILGVGGLSVNYDAGMFHAGGFLFFADDIGGNATTFGIGGRFYYHLHSTAMSDFGVGASLGITNTDPGGEADSLTGVFIQPGFQIRLFVASNVALSAGGGLNIGAADADGLLLDGDLTGSFGVHYYFF